MGIFIGLAVGIILGVAFAALSGSPTEVTVAIFPREWIKKFVISRQYICPTDSCAINIQYEIDTTSTREFSVLLSVKKPDGTEEILNRSTSFDWSFPGNHRIFTGPGEYVFTLEVSGGGLTTAVRQERNVTLFGPAGGIPRFQPVFTTQPIPSNSTNSLRMSLFDIIDDKQTGAAICTKYTKLKRIEFKAVDPTADSTILDFRITNGRGSRVGQASISAGNTWSSPVSIPIDTRLDFDLILSNTNVFPVNIKLTRDIEMFVECI